MNYNEMATSDIHTLINKLYDILYTREFSNINPSTYDVSDINVCKMNFIHFKSVGKIDTIKQLRSLLKCSLGLAKFITDGWEKEGKNGKG